MENSETVTLTLTNATPLLSQEAIRAMARLLFDLNRPANAQPDRLQSHPERRVA